MRITPEHLDILVTIASGLFSLVMALFYILYRQITFIGKAFLAFQNKVNTTCVGTDDVERRLDIMHQLINENIRILELEIKHIEKKVDGKKTP